MAWPLAQALQPGSVIYDCADELSGFSGAPRELLKLEAALLAAADRVFVTSPALATARAAAAGPCRHPPLSLLLNRVDPDFAARSPGGGWAYEEAAGLIGRLPPLREGGVRAGYAGAIDERLDLPLLAALADARPQWQFLITGPVSKIDPQALPQRPNMHWLGPQPYP
ncbi:MAG: hypothetical protein LH480_01100, partial [Rubrivivax sp.]|nr:hypothetical protein [Rubrivivax sp.]